MSGVAQGRNILDPAIAHGGKTGRLTAGRQPSAPGRCGVHRDEHSLAKRYPAVTESAPRDLSFVVAANGILFFTAHP
ncbi:hypothetical protein PMI07_006118 [Rhizobium sp. CF080]|nr:hypothetical protein PMI07_006118 [Rhizobium sp. CF080]